MDNFFKLAILSLLVGVAINFPLQVIASYFVFKFLSEVSRVEVDELAEE